MDEKFISNKSVLNLINSSNAPFYSSWELYLNGGILGGKILEGRALGQKAAEMIGDIGEPEAVEPLRNAKFGNELVQKEVDAAIKKIHKRFFTRECPFCAEIIKNRANICKHCGKEVGGV